MLSKVSLHTINVKGGKWNNTNWLTDEPIMLNDTTAQVLLGDVDNPEREFFYLIKKSVF
jgi:hypothetical protein